MCNPPSKQNKRGRHALLMQFTRFCLAPVFRSIGRTLKWSSCNNRAHNFIMNFIKLPKKWSGQTRTSPDRLLLWCTFTIHTCIVFVCVGEVYFIELYLLYNPFLLDKIQIQIQIFQSVLVWEYGPSSETCAHTYTCSLLDFVELQRFPRGCTHRTHSCQGSLLQHTGMPLVSGMFLLLGDYCGGSTTLHVSLHQMTYP